MHPEGGIDIALNRLMERAEAGGGLRERFRLGLFHRWQVHIEIDFEMIGTVLAAPDAHDGRARKAVKV